MDKEKARAEMHKRIDDNFDEMWNRYTVIKNHIEKQGQDMITNLNKGDRFNAKRNFDNLNTIEKNLIIFPESLSHDSSILRSDLRNLCNSQRDLNELPSNVSISGLASSSAIFSSSSTGS